MILFPSMILFINACIFGLFSLLGYRDGSYRYDNGQIDEGFIACVILSVLNFIACIVLSLA